MADLIRTRVWALLIGLLLWPPAAHAQAQTQDKPIGEAPAERDAEDVFLRGQRVLLGRGQVVLDVGQFYARSDTLQLALFNDSLALATREQTVLTTVLFGRLGVLHETEVFAGTAFVHQRQRVFYGDANLAETRQSDIGGFALGVRRTFMREGRGRPDVIGTFDVQVPTSDTSYVLGGGFAAVKSIDPLVLFVGVNYHRSLSHDREDGIRLQSANRADVSLGYALSLNDSLAISTAATALFTRALTVDGDPSRRFDAFSLRFALTSALSKGLFIEPSVSVGLSGPDRSFAMGVTIPYSF